MNNTKAVIAVVAHIALIVFVVFAVWPALKGTGSDGYNTKSAGVIVNKPAGEEVVEELEATETVDVSMPEETTEAAADVVEATDAVDVEAVTEQVEVIEAVVEEVTTETVVEEVVAEVAAVETPATGGGQVHVVTAQGLKYEPLVTVIALGDTVAWENMSSHDTQAFADLIPEGAEVWHSAMGENYQQTFTQEGIYVYKCTPHIGAGMGGVVIVGKPVNLAAIKAAPVKGAAKRLVKKAIKAAEAM